MHDYILQLSFIYTIKGHDNVSYNCEFKGKTRGENKGLVALTWQLLKSKLTGTYILNSVESMQMCTGLHHYGMLLVYGTQPPVHF